MYGSLLMTNLLPVFGAMTVRAKGGQVSGMQPVCRSAALALALVSSENREPR